MCHRNIPQATPLSLHPSTCLSVRSFTAFSGLCSFVDRAHGRIGIKFSMLMYSDDSADIDADGYCCHFMSSSVSPTVRGLGFWCCGQIACKKVYILACWCIQMSYPPFINAYGYYCPSVHWSGHLGLGLLGLGLVRGGLSYITWGWLLSSLGDTRDICCLYWQHILVLHFI